MKRPVNKLKTAKYPNGDFTQWFGENPQLYARFELKGHNGVDIVRPHGEVMYAIESGTVVNAKDTPDGFGIHIRLISDNKNERGYYHEWTYGHCSRLLVKQGDHVDEGQAIALIGNTGFVVSGATPFWKNNPYAGTHLHLGLREVKRPRTGGWKYEGSDIRLSVVNSNNGYKGAIDPLPTLWEADDIIQTDVWRQSALTVVSLLKTVINLYKK
jgi:murein DD-endopeptidase MepM/ murein hydrolase activator NlpD